MQNATTTIETESHRQAWDWSLVLVSQGIEPILDQNVETGMWILTFPETDFDRATEAIRAFKQENATPWRHELKWTGLLFDWRSTFWWAAVTAISIAAWTSHPKLLQVGMMDNGAFRAGAWWRAFTAVTLHADAAHLALNAATGFLLLGLAMGFYGAGSAILAAFCSGAAANAAEIFFRSGAYRSLGASGMVMAALGLLAAQSLFERHHSPREWIGRGVLASSLLLVMIGLDTKSDILAHLLGFAFGLGAGVILCLIRPIAARPRMDALAALVCAVLLGLVWTLALRR